MIPTPSKMQECHRYLGDKMNGSTCMVVKIRQYNVKPASEKQSVYHKTAFQHRWMRDLPEEGKIMFQGLQAHCSYS